MSSSTVAPALRDIAHDLSISRESTSQLVLSIFVLFYGIVPVLAGPLSEQYGRVPVLQVGIVIFVAFNAACGGARTAPQILTFRALSGLGGGVPVAIAPAVIGDLFHPEQRGRAIAIYNMCPLLGPSLGPIIGSAITQYISWRWIFYVMSLVDLVVLIISLALLRETYEPVLLKRQQKQSDGVAIVKRPVGLASFAKTLASNLYRPIRMLYSEQVVQLLAVYVGILYGIMYLVLSTFSNVWVVHYSESIFVGGLNYISLGLGYVVGSQVCAFFLDKIYIHLKQRNGDAGRPEFRLPLAILSAMLVPAGLVVYGWSVENRIFWLVPDVGAFLFSMGAMIGMQCTTNYLIDAYSTYTASVLGAVLLLRGFAGFGFPLFAPYMYASLGYGWGNTLLAFLALGFGLGAPVLLWFFGLTMREHKGVAAG